LIDDAAPRLRTGSGWALASVAVAFGAGLVRTVVIARWLDPIDIGLMGIALLALGFIEAVGSTGLDTALVAQRKDVERYLDPAFTIQLIRGLIASGFLWVAAPMVAWGFRNGAAVDIIRAVGAIAAVRGLSNPAVALAVRRMEFRGMFWWSLPGVLSSLALTVWLAWRRGDVWALVIGTLAGQIIAAATSYGLVRRMPKVDFEPQRMIELIRFGRFVSGSRALMYFAVSLDSAVVGLTMGTQALGLYQFATRVAELPVVTFTRAIGQVALPALGGLQANVVALRRTWRSMLGWILTVNGSGALLIVLFAPIAVQVVAGEQWLPAVPLMRVLALAMVFRAVVVLSSQLLDAVRQPALTLRLNGLRLAVLAVLLPLLATWNGLHGIALAVLLASAGAALFAGRLSARVLRYAGESQAAG
jgi:PST family polysaccharide transporter/lipopolysaccharide exporter